MDFDWIWHLHLAIDDASGEVVGAYFGTQETLKATTEFFLIISLSIMAYLLYFYTDRWTVFRY